MKLYQLNEMPVGDIKTKTLGSGNFSSFPERDWRMATRPAWKHSVHRLFKQSPYKIDLHLFNLNKHSETFADIGYDDLEDDLIGGPINGITDRLYTPEPLDGIVSQSEIPEPKPGIITVILFHHLGGTIPLTPWMVAHRMAHSILNHFEIFVHLFPSAKFQGDDGAWEAEWRELLDTFSMKAARDRSIKFFDSDELACEVIAEFIITGSIRVNRTRVAPNPEVYQKYLISTIKPTVDHAVGRIWVAD